jgi:outer membrane lipoprotein-sorting protein
MRRYLTALPVLGLCLAACSQPSPVDQVVAANLTARGGVERIKAVRSIRETATVTASGGRIAHVVRELKRPGMFRLEFTSQGTTSVFAHDGEVGWQVAPLQGVLEPQLAPPDADAAAGLDQRDLEGPLVDWREKGHSVELVGRESLPSGEAFKLEVRMADGVLRYDYVDATTSQVVRSDVTRIVQGRPVQLQNAFSDFREVDGLVFPHAIETRAADRPEVLRITIDTIELDPELDDERFRFPGVDERS